MACLPFWSIARPPADYVLAGGRLGRAVAALG